jgi:hypothetical protein
MSDWLFGEPNVNSPTECTVSRTKSHALISHYVRKWHSTLPESPPGMRVGFVIYAPNLAPVAVAMWGRPTARLEDQENVLELTRLAHSPYAPYNLGSWCLARMRRWVRENMPQIERVISYQNADEHDGAIYKADNWEQVYERFTEHTWTNRPGRAGTEAVHKIKWQRRP